MVYTFSVVRQNKLFAIQPIDVNESQASSPLDVVNLSAFAVKFHGDGDTRSLLLKI